MIYMIDEDELWCRVRLVALRRAGYSVEWSQNADEALRRIRAEGKATIDYILLDVMIPGEASTASSFNLEDTENYLLTGVLFADILAEEPDLRWALSRTAFLTMASDETLLGPIKKRSNLYGIPVLNKREFVRPSALVEWIKEQLGDLGGMG